MTRMIDPNRKGWDRISHFR